MVTTQPAQRSVGPTITATQLQSIKNPRWLNLIRRLEQLALSQNGYAILHINVVVDREGAPQVWTTPQMTCIEPKDAAQDFLDILRGI